MEQIVTLLKRFCNNGYQASIAALSGLAALFAPAIPIVLTVFCFIFADTYYGYKVSKKYGHKLESRGLWKMVWKLKDCFILIVLGLLVDKFILLTYQDLTSVKIVAGAICSAEGLSLLEAFRALHPNALLSKILAKVIRSKAEKYLDVDLSDIVDLK